MILLNGSSNHESSSEDDRNRFYAKPNLYCPSNSESDTEQQSENDEQTNGVKAMASPKNVLQGTIKAKRHRGKDEVKAPAKKAKFSEENDGTRKISAAEIEAMLAQTYVKGNEILRNRYASPSSRLNKGKTGSAHKGSEEEKQENKPRTGASQEGCETPPVKDYSQKTPHIWSTEDELSCAKTLLASSTGEGHIDMTAFYERVKGILGFHSSNSQLYEKARRMKARYQCIKVKLDEGKINGEKFRFRSSHEENLFKIWKQVWGYNAEKVASYEVHDQKMEENPRDGEGLEKQARKPVEDGYDASIKDINRGKPQREDKDEHERTEEENPRDGEGLEKQSRKPVEDGYDASIKDINGGKPQRQDKDEHERTENTLSQKVPPASAGRQNGNSDGNVYNILQEESRVMIDQVKGDIQNILADALSKTAALIDSVLKHASFPPVRGIESKICDGIGLYAALSPRVMGGLHSVKKFHSLDGTKAQVLQQRWREQKIQELKVFSQHLRLLQEECELRLTDLEATDDAGRS
eukprot:Gb_09819 [translate_table: standard]